MGRAFSSLLTLFALFGLKNFLKLKLLITQYFFKVWRQFEYFDVDFRILLFFSSSNCWLISRVAGFPLETRSLTPTSMTSETLAYHNTHTIIHEETKVKKRKVVGKIVPKVYIQFFFNDDALVRKTRLNILRCVTLRHIAWRAVGSFENVVVAVWI